MKKVIEVTIDMEELTMRIAEACLGLIRPEGCISREVLEEMALESAETVAGFRRAAAAAGEYVAECITATGTGVGYVH